MKQDNWIWTLTLMRVGENLGLKVKFHQFKRYRYKELCSFPFSSWKALILFSLDWIANAQKALPVGLQSSPIPFWKWHSILTFTKFYFFMLVSMLWHFQKGIGLDCNPIGSAFCTLAIQSRDKRIKAFYSKNILYLHKTIK